MTTIITRAGKGSPLTNNEVDANFTNLNSGKAEVGANTDITSVALTTGTVSTAPSGSNDIANKNYVDGVASGINFHPACDFATTADLGTVTYANGTAGVGATLTKTSPFAVFSVDGSSPAVGKRILVKNQTTQSQNGAYVVTSVGSGSVGWVLTRATDYDTSGAGTNEVDQGDFILVLGGSTQSNSSWVQQTPLPITIGSTSIVFVQFAAPYVFTYPGAGIVNSTGSAWGTSYTTSGTGSVVALTASPTFTGTTNVGTLAASGDISLLTNVTYPANNNTRLASISGVGGALGGFQLAFYTGGSSSAAPTERMRIDPSGYVGIGTAVTAEKLTINGSISFSGNNSIKWNTYFGSGNVYMANGYACQLYFDPAGGTLRYLTAASNGSGAGAAATLVDRFAIDPSGNVGIGTTSPQGKLDVNGNISLPSTFIVGANLATETGTISGATSPFYGVNIATFTGLSGPSLGHHGYYGQIFSTAGVERMRIDTSGNLQFNSGYGSVATAYGCRAWVNFNGTGTVAIRASGNVSSITDNGVGDYTVNFTTAMPDANFSCSALITRSGNGSATDAAQIVSQATGTLRIQTWWANFSAGGQFDPATVAVAIFR